MKFQAHSPVLTFFLHSILEQENVGRESQIKSRSVIKEQERILFGLNRKCFAQVSSD